METTPAFDRSGFKAECTRRRTAGLMVTGNTYWHRDKLKAMGGIWDAVAKGWLMPDRAAYEAGMDLAAGRTKGRKGNSKRVTQTSASTFDGIEPDSVEFEATPVPATSATECGDMPF